MIFNLIFTILSLYIIINLFSNDEHININDYDITMEYGFLSNELQIPQKFNIFNKIINALTDNTMSGEEFRDIVDKFNNNTEYTDEFFNTITDDLNYNELKSIYCIFGFICQKYERCCGIDNLKKVIPYRFGIIWHNTSIKLGLKTVPTYSSLILYNWRWQNNTIVPIYNLSLTSDETHFYNIHQRIEFEGIKLINIVNQLINKKNIDIQFMFDYLNIFNDTIKNITYVLIDMNKKCNNEIFFNNIRNYISGYDKPQFYNDGICIDKTDIKFNYTGGSGAQSPIMSLIEALFKINYKDNHIKKFMSSSVDYMSEKHKNYINLVNHKTESLKNLVLKFNNTELIKLFNELIDNYCKFRTSHIKIVGNYIHRFISNSNNITIAGNSGTSNLVDDESASPLIKMLNIIYIDTKNEKINLDNHMLNNEL